MNVPRRARIAALLVLLLCLAVAAYGIAGGNLTVGEAHTAHRLSDTLRAPLAPDLRAGLRFVAERVQATWTSEASASLPARALFTVYKAWVVLAGEREISLRYPFLLAWLLLAALGFRVVLRRVSGQRRAGLAALWVLLLALWLFSLPRPADWRSVAQRIASERNPLHPAIVLWSPASVPAYYARFYPMTAGFALRVGWQAEGAEDRPALLATLQNAPRLWLFSDGADEDALSAWEAALTAWGGAGRGEYRLGAERVVLWVAR